LHLKGPLGPKPLGLLFQCKRMRLPMHDLKKYRRTSISEVFCKQI
jgi:hypothetical protein